MSRVLPTASDVCANCECKGGEDGIKLKDCTACRLVKYCGVDCQRAHRKQHKKVCKKRAAELREERLYGQGHERPEGDFCPLCTLPIPFPMGEHSGFMCCCMKKICNGCVMAVGQRIIGNTTTCAFCRTEPPKNDVAMLSMVQKLIDAGDADAMNFLATHYNSGGHGLEKDVQKAID